MDIITIAYVKFPQESVYQTLLKQLQSTTTTVINKCKEQLFADNIKQFLAMISNNYLEQIRWWLQYVSVLDIQNTQEAYVFSLC